jgi:hypothetical protein
MAANRSNFKANGKKVGQNDGISSSLYNKYVAILSEFPNIVATKHTDEDSIYMEFVSPKPNSLKVTLYKQYASGYFVGIKIAGVDTSYWHTADENENLDFYVDLALAALGGNIRHSNSRFMKFKEICFEIKGVWYCTRVAGANSYHYISKKKKL